MKKYLTYNVVIKPEPEGGFTVTVPALPGCVTYGQSLEEAKLMAQDAISAYINSLKKHKEPIPSDDASFISSITLIPKQNTLMYA
jgi:predicted RNase H-like HicB family nuclease